MTGSRFKTSFSLDEKNDHGRIKTALGIRGAIYDLEGHGYSVTKIKYALYRDDYSVEGWQDDYQVRLGDKNAMLVRIKQTMRDTHTNNMQTEVSVDCFDDNLTETFDMMKRKVA